MNTTTPCGCCAGTEILTPQPTANRPGLDALAGRIGTHATFLETMKARLSSTDFPELRALATRDPSDPSLALLDAWATVADVLAFYQERLANEGYLRTATERRSVLEIARLIGYAPRPGVSASAHLAYTIDADRSVNPPASIKAIIPAGSRAQSIPGPGELPQTFETSAPLEARTEWNNLQPRLTQLQTAESIRKSLRIFLKGTSTNLQVNDALLIEGPDGERPTPMRVVEVIADAPANRTEVRLRRWMEAGRAVAAVGEVATRYRALAPGGQTSGDVSALLKDLEDAANKPVTAAKMEAQVPDALRKLNQAHNGLTAKATVLDPWLAAIIGQLEQAHANLRPFAEKKEDADGKGDEKGRTPSLIDALKTPASIPPAHAIRLERDPSALRSTNADLAPRLLAALDPALRDHLYPAARGAVITAPKPPRVHVLRAVAPLFGHNSVPRPLTFNQATGTILTSGEWPLIEGKEPRRKEHEKSAVIDLAGSFEKITPDSLLIVETAATNLTASHVQVFRADAVNAGLSRADYGLCGKITRIQLAPPDGKGRAAWIAIEDADDNDDDIEALRQTVVFAQSEKLELAEEPIAEPIGNCDQKTPAEKAEIELDAMYDGLDPGRWLIVAGERVHIPGTSGVRAAELVMLAGVKHDVNPALPGDKLHTYLTLSTSLAYCYKRDTVTIHGNVVKATHGETRREVLGSGDSALALQTFELKQPPLTFVSAPDPSGIRSTLRVRVNEVEWHEADSLAGLGPVDRKFVTRIDDDGKTKIVFGNGVSGARPPTGTANLRADYRNGIGKGGNVRAGQIALLSSRPLGVKEVINPLRASGGADRETRDQARRNAPLAVQALDRLVSVQDYADFARTFAGIGKAHATEVSDHGSQLVHLTIAGADDIPIETHSDLFVNLKRALRDFGDPAFPVQIAVRELLALFIAARVRVLPDYEWESVEPRVRAALLETFSFDRRELGQGVAPGEVIAAIQRVRGVQYVDLDVLAGIEEAQVEAVFAATLGKTALTKTTLIPEGAGPKRVAARLATVNPTGSEPRIRPAQLAFLLPTVPDTLLLTEIPE